MFIIIYYYCYYFQENFPVVYSKPVSCNIIIILRRNLSGRMTFARREVIRPVVKVSPVANGLIRRAI